MPRGKRAEFKNETKTEQVAKVFSTLSPGDLASKPARMAALRKAGLNVSGPTISAAMKRLRGPQNGAVPTMDDIMIVSRAAIKVGGLEKLKDTIVLIERVKDIS